MITEFDLCCFKGDWLIITDPHEILLFSLCIKSTIVVFKVTKQLWETEAVLFVSREIIRGNIMKRAK